MLMNVDTGEEQEFSDARFDSGGSSHVAGRRQRAGVRRDRAVPADAGTGTASSGRSRIRPARSAGSRPTSRAIATSPQPRAGERWWPCGTRCAPASGWRQPATPHGPGRSPTPAMAPKAPPASASHRDGRIVYSAITQNSWDIWIANGDGSQARQLTSDPGVENQPQVLPSGTGIVFTSRDLGCRRRPGSAPSISTAATQARSRPAAESTVDTSRPSESTCTSRRMEKGTMGAYRVPLAGGSREPLFADRVPPAAALRLAQRLSR